MRHTFCVLGLLVLVVGVSAGRAAAEAERVRIVVAGPDRVTDGWVANADGVASSFDEPDLCADGTAWAAYPRVLIRFDLSSVDPRPYARLAKATLRLVATEVSNPSEQTTTVAACRLPWDEKATWSTPDGRATWPKAGKSPANIDHAAMEEGAQSRVIEAAGVVELDVTDVVQRWLYQGEDNHGFLIRTGGTIWGRPDAGGWKLTLAASESPEGNGPALVIELAGTPPTPETIGERTLRWYPSAHLPPVRDPYMFYWGFADAPSFPGAVANTIQVSGGVGQGFAQGGLLPVAWFHGPQNPWLNTESQFIDAYASAARGETLAIMVDEWQSPKTDTEPGTPLHPDDPYGITGSIKGMIEAKKVDPSLFITVAWRGEPSIGPAVEADAPDLLMIESYTHINKRFPLRYAIDEDNPIEMPGIKKRIDFARELGMIERSICWLGHVNKPEDYHEGYVLTAELLDRQIAELRRYAPEMPGVAFYYGKDPALVAAADAACRRHFVDPAPTVVIEEPTYEAQLGTLQAVVRARAEAKGDRAIVRYRWFIDNRLVAETAEPRYVWDLRGERAGAHLVTVHAIDSGWNRAAAQVPVTTARMLP